MDQEIVFFRDDKAGLLITEERLVFGRSSCATRDVSRVAITRVLPSQALMFTCLGIGMVLLFLGAVFPVLALFGVMLATTGMVLRCTNRPRFVVRLTLRDEPVDAYASMDIAYLDTVIVAINRAIRAAGSWRPPPHEYDSEQT
ncbi:MAG: hypothetical protein HY532_00035 [Chloroflexi bacterium]|nr:hypothetical protein [Chloroflexota bacterium]